MLKNFKAKVRRLASLPGVDLAKLLTWLDKQPVGFDNPNILVASAADESGSPIIYTMVEPVLVINQHAIAPEATPPAAFEAGLAMDEALARVAQEEGVGRILIVLPDHAPRDPKERTLRVLERPVPHRAMGGVVSPAQSPTAYFN